MAASAAEQVNGQNPQQMGSPKLQRAQLDSVADAEQNGVPLQTPWTFWLDKAVAGISAAEYEAGMKMIYNVSTVQGFWQVYNNIPDATRLTTRYSYHLMRHDRRPIWEADYHCRGGQWRFKVHKQDTSKAWKELLLGAIGETMSDCMAEGDEISGLSVSVREREDLIQIWNTRADLHEKSTIVEKVKELLSDVQFSAIFYKTFHTHQDFEHTK